MYSHSSHFPFDTYNTDLKQQAFGLDFTSFHSPADIAAPSVDSFELDLDLLSQDNDFFQLEVTQVNSAYSQPFFPSCGPGSAITRSSESSAPDTWSFYSEPFQSPLSTYSFPLDDMDFQKIRVDDLCAQSTFSALDGTNDPTSFGPLPPTPPRSPPALITSTKPPFPKSSDSRTSYSDYSPSKRESIPSNVYSQVGYTHMFTTPTVSPSHISNAVPATPATRIDDDARADPRRKYKCTSCPRAFARAYNLKTHMATHDPNRLKPHVCPHSSCGRSFSRKHDLGRHLISIHREDSDIPAHRLTLSKASIGVEKGLRGWCESCGKGYIGRSASCHCRDIK